MTNLGDYDFPGQRFQLRNESKQQVELIVLRTLHFDSSDRQFEGFFGSLLRIQKIGKSDKNGKFSCLVL